MKEQTNKDYLNLVEFWNKSFALTNEDKEQLSAQINADEDWKQLAPSQKLFDCLSLFKDKSNVLDYGCGSGWASIIMAKNGTKSIAAVDVASLSIDMLNCYTKAFKVDNQIKGLAIDCDWLSKQEENVYDGLFCSNVIDVVPLEMAEDIIKESARVVEKDALVVFSLNYYIDPKEMEKRGCVVISNNIYINNVLRLMALKDEEWLAIFNKYYQLVKLDYFAWPGEEKETRRLFILKRK